VISQAFGGAGLLAASLAAERGSLLPITAHQWVVSRQVSTVMYRQRECADKVYGSYGLGQIRSQRPSTSVGLRYGDHMHWATTITSTGALLGGLAIVIAFIQLGNQREDQLRAQISKVSVWIQADDPRMAPNQPNGR